jgi:hypothetical protein
MARLSDWRTRLQNLIAAKAGVKFQPGTHDCSTFGADVVEAVRGDDPAAPYRGQYSTVAEGLALLDVDGYADQVDFIEQNFPETTVFEAQPGDLCLVYQGGEVGVGCVLGAQICVLTLRTLGYLPLTAAQRTFKVE